MPLSVRPRRWPAATAVIASAVALAVPGSAVASPPRRSTTSSPSRPTTYQQIYSLINSATSTLDMTMYELTDTTAESDLVADAKRGVTVRVILDVNREKTHNTPAFNYLSSERRARRCGQPTKYAATHQKTITVDKVESAIMSGNLTSQYYATSRDFASSTPTSSTSARSRRSSTPTTPAPRSRPATATT